MFFTTPDLQDLTINHKYVKCKVHFSFFNERRRRAQIWLDGKIMELMAPYVPYRTGRLLNTLKAINAGARGTGKVRTVALSYGPRLYNGINPQTGRPYHWTNPNTQPFWGAYTIQNYRAELVQGVSHVIKTGNYP